VLSVLLHARTKRELLNQLDETLAAECDEVISVLESVHPVPSLPQFLAIETRHPNSSYVFYYRVLDEAGRTLARSSNLSAAELPVPRPLGDHRRGAVDLRTAADPRSPDSAKVRLRSARVLVRLAGRERSPIVIQTAISLGPFEEAVRQSLHETLLVAGASLAAPFGLRWLVTNRALEPVSALVKKASEITATNVRERLPLSGRGDELDELAGVLNDMLERLGASLRQMEQFASGAAHQLRTPIARVRGELDLLLRNPQADPLRAQLEAIQEELDRLIRACGRLLLLAQLDHKASEASLRDEQTDLEEVAGDSLDYMSPLALDRRISLRRNTATAAVRGNRPLLGEAVLNLLDNAIRYTQTGGMVTVSTDVVGGMGQLTVEDNGPGVPPDERENIFRPFYRLRRGASEPANDGTGLGLAIVLAIARAHGGKVELEEAPAGGSRFRLVIPALPAREGLS